MRVCLFSLFCLLLLTQCATSRRLSKRCRDKIVLPNGETATGKVLESDSVRVLMQFFDGSRSSFSWANIDTVTGQSYRTPFVSFSTGWHQAGYWSVLHYENREANSLGWQLRVGRLNFRKRAFYAHMTRIPAQPYRLTALGAGHHRYLWGNYAKKQAAYLGGQLDLLFVETNRGPAFRWDLHVGAERWLGGGFQAFAEWGMQRTVWNIYRRKGFSVQMGVRFSRDFRARYRRINEHDYLGTCE